MDNSLARFVEHVCSFYLAGRKTQIGATQHGERQDVILVLAPFERIADQVGNRPDEANDFAVVVH